MNPRIFLPALPGCYDAMGRPEAANPLESLIGGKFVRKLDSIDNWMRLDASEDGAGPRFAPDLRRDWAFLVKGPAASWKAETAPATVDTIVTDDPASRTLRVHLLGYNAPPQTLPVRERPYVLPALMEDAPIFRTILELRDPPQTVTALSPATMLKQEGRRVEVTVSDVHEVAMVRY